jgi:Holliday junction resolvase-like predicted endonuclease
MPISLFISAPVAPYAVGAFVASVGWLVAVLVLLGSGTAPMMMGDIGEQWTAQELQKLRRQGWRMLHQVKLGVCGDIDHIAIGPAGVLVVETKWSRSTWNSEDDCFGRINMAVNGVKRRRRDVWGTLKTEIGDAPVLAVVALWSAAAVDPDGLPTDRSDGVVVIRGNDLATWAGELPDAGLDAEAIDALRGWLAPQVEGRERYEAERNTPPPRGFADLAWDGFAYASGCLAAIYLEAVAVSSLGMIGFITAPVGLTAVGLLMHRYATARSFARGWLIGLAGLTVTLGAVFAAVALQ